MRSAANFACVGAVDVLCLYNEGYDPVGVNYRTNTTSPGVVRTGAPPKGRDGRDGA